MKTVTIKAYNGQGDDKSFAGEEKANKPDTLEEAAKEYTDEVVLKGFWKSHVIYVQNRIRTGGGTSDRSKVSTLKALARRQKAEGDSTLYDKLVAVEMIKE